MFEKPGDMKTAKSAGSPAFLPPELCGKHAEVSGTAADIWSMGVSLYCLRYGRIPFNRAGMMEMYDAIKSEQPHLPEDENPALVDLFGKLLEKDAEKRIEMAQLRVRSTCHCFMAPFSPRIMMEPQHTIPPSVDKSLIMTWTTGASVGDERRKRPSPADGGELRTPHRAAE